MKPQTLVPGVQHGGKAVDLGTQCLVGGELFRERPGEGAKEQVVGLLGVRPEETLPQLGGQGEGDQEVRRINEFSQLALHPPGGGAFSALRTGFVVARMVGEVNPSAGFTFKNPPAQGRGAAMGNRPDGATLGRRKSRVGLKKLRQKTAQRRQDRGV
jgi:hypothetical protein